MHLIFNCFLMRIMTFHIGATLNKLVITKSNTFCITALMLSFFAHCDSDGHSFPFQLKVSFQFQIGLIYFHLSHIAINCFDILQYKMGGK